MSGSSEFNPALKPGQILTNTQLIGIFKCACEGGIRYSSKTGTIILIKNNLLSPTPAHWHDNRLDYIGQGKTGDQQLTRMNKRLYEFLTAAKNVYLFEVHARGKYTFVGKVKLYAAPYQKEIVDGPAKRKVWVFPIEIKH